MYKQDLTKLNCFSKSSMTCFSDGNKNKGKNRMEVVKNTERNSDL